MGSPSSRYHLSCSHGFAVGLNVHLVEAARQVKPDRSVVATELELLAADAKKLAERIANVQRKLNLGGQQ